MTRLQEVEAKLEKVRAFLEEQRLGQTGAVDAGTAAKMGRLLGASAIVTGAVSQFGVKTRGSDMLIAESKRQVAEAVVDVRIVDVVAIRVLSVVVEQNGTEFIHGRYLDVQALTLLGQYLRERHRIGRQVNTFVVVEK